MIYITRPRQFFRAVLHHAQDDLSRNTRKDFAITSFISGAYQERKVVAGQLRLHSSNRHNSISMFLP
jgi:hypothetical protein